jgi:hypothetical protein
MPVTEPRHFGRANNPWALDRTTGGSSGGSSAHVAARSVPMAHATDGGARSERATSAEGRRGDEASFLLFAVDDVECVEDRLHASIGTPERHRQVGRSHDNATRQLAHCLERANVMLDELEARPDRNEAEAEDRFEHTDKPPEE